MAIVKSSPSISLAEQAEDVSVEEMWQTLEEFGIKQQAVEKDVPSFITLFELHSAIKKIKKE